MRVNLLLELRDLPFLGGEQILGVVAAHRLVGVGSARRRRERRSEEDEREKR